MIRPVILIPTYNEAKTVGELLDKLTIYRDESGLKFDVIIIDDNSPDMTAKLVEEMSISWVMVLRRMKKDGLGAAYREGFKKVLADQKYTHVVTMDADGSHRVEDLSAMFAAIKSSTSQKLLILGTRWISGGGTVNWPIFRIFISKAGTRYAKSALGINLDDLTGGFRIYSFDLLNSLNLEDMHTAGYCFQIEMVMAAELAGSTFIQVPITFVERREGQSKMTAGIAVEALIFVSKQGFKRLVRLNNRR